MPGRTSDWATPDDYDLEDAAWNDCTLAGSSYQQQVNLTGLGFRHRKLTVGSPWKEGPDPTR